MGRYVGDLANSFIGQLGISTSELTAPECAGKSIDQRTLNMLWGKRGQQIRNLCKKMKSETLGRIIAQGSHSTNHFFRLRDLNQEIIPGQPEVAIVNGQGRPLMVFTPGKSLLLSLAAMAITYEVYIILDGRWANPVGNPPSATSA